LTLVPEAVTSTAISRPAWVELADASEKLLHHVECKNVLKESPPPITTYQSLNDLLRVPGERLDQEHLEAWWVHQTGFQNDPLTRGTMTRYQQMHGIQFSSWVWKTEYYESHKYIHNKVEEVCWTLEKNKGFLGQPSMVEEVRQIVAVHNSVARLEEAHLFSAQITFQVLVYRQEASGRV
tara:strand:- start:484 stop:1023 length:540 start_codon:yes stop_codon:yes gene_type:complete